MKIFSTDHYFHIGRAHTLSGKPNQDYAMSGVLRNGAYAIVSDGCSTGGATDVGARVIALSLVAAIRELHLPSAAVSSDEMFGPLDIVRRQNIRTATAMKHLGLSQDDALATCVFAYLSENGGYVHARGDGAVALVKKDGTLILTRIEWEDNMPFYPAYAYKQKTLDDFIAAHGGDIKSERVTVETCMLGRDGSYSCETARHMLSDGLLGTIIPIGSALMEELSFVAVFSDGISQCGDLDWKDAARSLVSYKNTAGEFVKRRMARFVKDEGASGRDPIDDIACAAISIRDDASGLP
ncbi:MAG: protein phosphatase 2C domain-containing protein [Parcubacteria group bacterium]|nr:protein phosphatase 2C domain-containing protein [Parcubacteria group bacterium]